MCFVANGFYSLTPLPEPRKSTGFIPRPLVCYIRATMNNNRLRSALITFAALLALLLQVQTAFACEMMEHPEPVSECCCGDIANGQAPDCNCCTPAPRISLKTEAQQRAALPTAQFALELPQLAPPLNQWPPIPLAPAVAPAAIPYRDPAHPGSRTWLSTLRLRL